MGPNPAFVIGIVVVGLLIGLLIGAVILRAAVSLANKILGNRQLPITDHYADGYQNTAAPIGGGNPYSDNPYEARDSPDRGIADPQAMGLIPEPSTGRAVAIVFVVFVFNAIIGFLLRNSGILVNLPIAVAYLLNQVVGFAILVPMYKALLPTTWPRAILVYFMNLLIVIGIVLVIGGIVFALSGAMR